MMIIFCLEVLNDLQSLALVVSSVHRVCHVLNLEKLFPKFLRSIFEPSRNYVIYFGTFFCYTYVILLLVFQRFLNYQDKDGCTDKLPGYKMH